METRNLLIREAAFRKDAAATMGLSNAVPLFERYAVLLGSWDPVLAVFGEAEDLREQNRILNLLRNQERQIHQALPELREQRFVQILSETGLRQDQGLRWLLESIRQEDVDFPRGFLHLRIVVLPEIKDSRDAQIRRWASKQMEGVTRYPKPAKSPATDADVTRLATILRAIMADPCRGHRFGDEPLIG